MIKYLSEFAVRKIRRDLESATGERFDLLNQDGLLSALATPRQSMFGEELYPRLIDKAATLFFLLIKNHPFYDGNKRIASTALRQFLAENGMHLRDTDATIAAISRAIASGESDTLVITTWLEHAIAPIS